MSTLEWFLAGGCAFVALYAGAWVVGSGFGGGFFRRKMRYHDEFLNQLESRSTENGTEEQKE